MTLAESKRFFILNEFWATGGALGIGDTGTDTFIANALATPNLGVGDQDLIGNQIIDPMVVLKLNVNVQWGPLGNQYTPYFPAIKVTAYLVAINDQIPNSTIPRITSVAEDQALFVRHPGTLMRWQINSQNVTVIKRKTLMFQGKNITSTGFANSVENKSIKIARRLRGKKSYEQSITQGGVITQSTYLKGWNYYWLVVSQISYGVNSASTAAVTQNPMQISADRYLYFKDF